jgi:DNA-binding response OmpR family regulator
MPTRILVVDDEADIARVLKMGLGQVGYEVDAFTRPKDALAHFKPDYYDLLLLDIRMVPLNGFELSRELIKRDSKPKVCFMTAFEVNLPESKAMFPSLKADGFMKKPFAIKDMVKMIERLLGPIK